jgi:hypothetical protein
MPLDELYRRQAALVVQTIPLVAQEDCFALKGESAFNLFVRDMPRLSVDIDLTYLPITDRSIALSDIDRALTGSAIASRLVFEARAFTRASSNPRTSSTSCLCVWETPK